MSKFSSEWLELREPVDHAARSEEIVSALCHYFLNDRQLIIADIGGGTGSTQRVLSPAMPQELAWHVLDNDPDLILEARNKPGGENTTFSSVDLANSITPVFEPVPDLVATSAFLDLVSLTWLEILVSEITHRRIPFYAALSYDGRLRCHPTHPLDDEIFAAFNKHQKTDKGFGPALGPDAAKSAKKLFENCGYTVFEAESNWEAGPQHADFLSHLIHGWHNAACEIREAEQSEFGTWLSSREEEINIGKLSVFTGHKDLLAVPPED